MEKLETSSLGNFARKLETLINLYISSYREARRATFIHVNT